MECLNKPITIRAALPSDALVMADILMRSWEAAYTGIIPEEYIREKNATRPAMWEKNLAAGQYPHKVILLGDTVVGIMRFDQPQDGDVGEAFYELHYIYLHPDYFRKGIGTKAMEYAFACARDMGKEFMTVWVLAENTNSIKFYEKCGFAADGKTKSLDYGKPLECIRMRKDLRNMR